MLPPGAAKKVTIYVNEDTRSHIEPLWSKLLNFLRQKHIAGATLLRANAGFGSHESMHLAFSEYAGEHRPVRIEFIESPDKVAELLPSLCELVTDGLVTVQDITVVKCASRDTGRKQPR